MAAATASASRATVEVNNVWKYVQSGIFEGFNFMTPEVQWVKDIKGLGDPWSGRALELVLDLNEGGRVASIPEGGYKARPAVPNASLGTVNIQQFSAGFVISELAKWADEGNKNQLEKQMKWSGRKVVEGIGRTVGDYFYGSSTGVMALTDSDLAGGTDVLTLYDGFGNSGIDDPAYLANLFREEYSAAAADGDWVAAVNSSSLVTSAIGYVTDRDTAAGTIDVTWNGAASESTNGLKIVKANSMENTTIAGTDFNRGLVGLQDILFSASLHGLTHDNWSAAFSDTSTGGRLTGVKIRKMFDAIEDYGPRISGSKILLTTKGVRRDMIDYERSSLRQNDPLAMEVDGEVKVNGYKIRTSRRVPPGFGIVYDDDKLRKIMYKPIPAESGSGGFTPPEGIHYPDQSMIRFDLPVVLGLVTLSRKSFAVRTGLTEQ
jgi:hypothetical protein